MCDPNMVVFHDCFLSRLGFQGLSETMEPGAFRQLMLAHCSAGKSRAMPTLKCAAASAL